MSSSRSQSPAPSRHAHQPQTPRQSRRNSTQPTRAKQSSHHHHHHQQGHQLQGPLSPTHSPKLESPPTSPNGASRHSPRPSAVESALDPLHQDDSRRRRRQKQHHAESPLKHSASLSSSTSDDPVSGSTAALPGGDALADGTPGKPARRRKGKSARQASPPPHLGEVQDGEASLSTFPSTTPPQTDLGALARPSRSVPPDPYLQAQRLDAAWDMPTVPSGIDSPKQSLSWQQELLKSGSAAGGVGSRGTSRGDSPVARPRSRGHTSKDSRASTHGSLSGGRARPPLHTSHSESGTTSAGASLNWQQELLLQTDISTSVQAQPQQQVSAPGGMTPARQRRNQIKDSITFGLTNLDLHVSEDDSDVFGSSNGRRAGQGNRHAQTPRARGSQPSSAAGTGFSTPTKLQPPYQPQPQQLPPAVEPRYAGPTFHNSPAPSSLPVPSFMLRRKVDVAV